MLCLPGFTPVMNVDQATGEIAGNVVRRLRKVPRSRSFARLGSFPALIKRVASTGSIPSKPRMTARLICALPGTLRRRSKRNRWLNGQVRNA
jgi:hypothetical protein